MTESKLISAMSLHTALKAENRKVLILQDCTNIDYSGRAGRIKENSGLGVSTRNSGLGYFLIAGLAVDADNLGIIGLADVKTWIREPDRERNIVSNDRKNKPIELKESYKWIESSIRVKQTFSDASQLIFVEDREGDIYENLSRLAEGKSDYVIRTSWNRSMSPGNYLNDSLKEEEGFKSILRIDGESKKRKKRDAQIEIKFKKLKIKKPRLTEIENGFKYPDYVESTMIEIIEQASSVPEKEAPIVWRLWTSMKVETLEDAQQIIRYYASRWLIEELFRLIKSKGFELESSQLEDGYGLRKLGVHTLHAATKVLQLKQARDGTTFQAVADCFTTEEQSYLELICSKLEGKTTKQMNPFNQNELAWASWIISRLGGWKGYRSQRPPGVITILKGMEHFNLMFQGWKIARDVYTR